MTTRLLVTGFGPYPGVVRNPTAELARRVAASPRLKRNDTVAASHVFEVSYAAVARDLPRLVERHRPDAILLLGLAPRERMARLELRGENRRRTLHPDATGLVPTLRRLDPSGPAERRSRIDRPALLAVFRSAGVPARISRDAGAYLCNAALYAALGATEGRGCAPPVVFVHLPLPHRLGRKGAALPGVVRSNMTRLAEALTRAALRLCMEARRARAGREPADASHGAGQACAKDQ